VAVGGSGIAVAVGVKVAVGVGDGVGSVPGPGDAADAAETWVRSAATSSRRACSSSLSSPQAASTAAADSSVMTTPKRIAGIVRSAPKGHKGDRAVDAVRCHDDAAASTFEPWQQLWESWASHGPERRHSGPTSRNAGRRRQRWKRSSPRGLYRPASRGLMGSSTTVAPGRDQRLACHPPGHDAMARQDTGRQSRPTTGARQPFGARAAAPSGLPVRHAADGPNAGGAAPGSGPIGPVVGPFSRANRPSGGAPR
jgi:hypothetical protein